MRRDLPCKQKLSIVMLFGQLPAAGQLCSAASSPLDNSLLPLLLPLLPLLPLPLLLPSGDGS